MKIEYFQTIRKRDFAEILENFSLNARCLVFTRPFRDAGHIATAFLIMLELTSESVSSIFFDIFNLNRKLTIASVADTLHRLCM